MARDVTFRLPAELARRAKILAAKQDSSWNALVREALEHAVEADRKHEEGGSETTEAVAGRRFDIPARLWTYDELRE